MSLEQLYREAAQNEQILRRYQSFELQMLSAGSFEELLQILLNTSVEFFGLAAVELWLNDPQESLAELVPEEFRQHPGIRLFRHERPFERLYAQYDNRRDDRCDNRRDDRRDDRRNRLANGQRDDLCNSPPPGVRLVSLHDTKQLPVLKGQGVRSAAMLPLHRKGRFVGSMHLGAKDEQRFTADKSTDFVAHLASIVAVCIENALAQEHLRRLSMLDMLTRVNNRRGFHLALDREVSRASRSGDPLCLLFVDLDHFKVINDSYGHPMGDKVLRVVAQLFRDTLRKVDHVCRYGGEEFAMVMPNCSRRLAMEIAERLRRRVSQLRIDLEDRRRESDAAITVTLSMGVCCWQPDRRIDSEEEPKIAQALIAHSDRGVYESKASGRNTIRYVAFQAA